MKEKEDLGPEIKSFSDIAQIFTSPLKEETKYRYL